MMSKRLNAVFFGRPSADVARDLIGCTLLTNGVGGVIVETEAYNADDPASHSFRGPTPRNAPMFGPAGHAYIYRIYGLHWCLNFTTGMGAAVLIRAIRPERGIDVMRQRRGAISERLLCAGPGRLCQALGITGELNGSSLSAEPFKVFEDRSVSHIAACQRIGISVATEIDWRFCEAGSPYLSKPVRV